MQLGKIKINILELSVGCVIVSSLALRNYQYLLYFFQAIMIVFCGRQLLPRMSKSYFLVTASFLLWCIASYAWAEYHSEIFGTLISLVQVYVICILLSGYVTSKQRVEKFISYYVIAGGVLVVNLLISTPVSEWASIINYSSGEYVSVSSSAGRLGSSVGMHPNTCAGVISMCLLCTLFQAYQNQKKRYFLLAITLGVLLLFAKSRTFLLIVIFGVVVYYVLISPSAIKKAMRVVTGVLLVVLALWAIMNVPILYNLVGYRVEGILAVFLAGEVDSSASARTDFIRIGLELFAKRPITGFGLANFAPIAYNQYSAWGQVYAHNGFVEILSGLGIVGAILYYAIRFNAFIRINRYYRKNKGRITKHEGRLIVFAETMFIALVIADMTNVSYTVEHFQYFHVLLITLVPALIKDHKYNW